MRVLPQEQPVGGQVVRVDYAAPKPTIPHITVRANLYHRVHRNQRADSSAILHADVAGNF